MDTTVLILDLIFSSIGMGYFVYGKRKQRAVALLAGLGLMLFPFFVDATWLVCLLGVALAGLPFVRRDVG